MAIEKVREYFEQFGIADRIMEFPVSSATVELAAEALGTEPCRIAKTLSFDVDGRTVLIVMAGDAKIDNASYRHFFRTKARMLKSEEVEERVGHAVGGVCPFAVNEGIDVYLDKSLERFETVFPACGSSSSAIEVNNNELFSLSKAIDWIAVTKLPEDNNKDQG